MTRLMAKRSQTGGDKPDVRLGVEPDADMAVEDQIRQVKRRLLGVCHAQLVEEKRILEKREAAIESRKRRG